MSELGPETRALLDRARAGMSPDAAAVRRMRHHIGVASHAAPAGLTLATKLGALAVVALGVAVAVVYPRTREPAPAPAPRAVVAPAAPAPPVVAPVAAVADDEITIEPSPPPRPRAAVRAVPGAARSPVADPAPPPAPAAPPLAEASAPAAAAPVAGIPLAREVELVDLAMAALRRGEPAAALREITRHAHETGGHGQLSEDAAAIEVEALCQLRADTAAGKLAAFDARFPRSAQRARLAAACP